ncbi:TetR/AcrR family transcriptional regulator [Rhodococcus sp. ACT016]|uniref:TetR/AcrR family transcriptional regulator n=1 Tax=Rhodococcus sp. ACT016 TaxID=3134808 RepID=UPI003D2B7B01
MSVTSVRDRVLAAALHIVGTEGVPAVTNRRIAAEAGVSLGSVTYHFASQSDLLRAALTGFVSEETTRLREIAETYRDTGLSIEDAAAITERIARDLAFSAERIAPFELYIQAGRDPELRDAADECFAAYDELTVTILGALGIPNPESLAPTLVATIAGLQLRRLATGNGGQDFSTAVLQLIRGAFLPLS